MKWAIDLLAGALSPHERDAVLGDLAEANASSAVTVRELLGLVIRRQGALCMHWRPWLVLPLACLLSELAAQNARAASIYLWLYAGNWDQRILDLPAFWYTLAGVVSGIGASCIAMALVAWVAGSAMAFCAPRTRYLSATIVALVLIARSGSTSAATSVNHAALVLPFYSIVFPLLMKSMVVLLPCCLGLRKRRIA
jgi:hypothetical protein